MDNYPDGDKFKQTNTGPEGNIGFQDQFRGLKESIIGTQQKEKGFKLEDEPDQKRIDRITKDLSNAFDKAKMKSIVPKPYFIQWCGHETGGFYTGPYHYTKDGIDRQKRQASMVCDQGTRTLQLDRNSSPSAVTGLTLDGKKIYGGHNYSNITQKSMYLGKNSAKIKARGFMDFVDVIFDENRKPTSMQNNLAIFSNIDEYMGAVKERFTKAKINTQDDMMSMFAKLSAYTGYNGIGPTYIIEYANSGFIRQARKLSTTSTTPEIIIPSGFSIHDALKRTKTQLYIPSLLGEMEQNGNAILAQKYTTLFKTIGEKGPTIVPADGNTITIQYKSQTPFSLKPIPDKSIKNLYTRYQIVIG